MKPPIDPGLRCRIEHLLQASSMIAVQCRCPFTLTNIRTSKAAVLTSYLFVPSRLVQDIQVAYRRFLSRELRATCTTTKCDSDGSCRLLAHLGSAINLNDPHSVIDNGSTFFQDSPSPTCVFNRMLRYVVCRA